MSLIIGKENIFDSEELIYELGDDLSSIAYILEGSVRIETETDKAEITAGHFIAGHDLCDGFYSADYFALPGCRLMVFPAEDIGAFNAFLDENFPIHEKYYIGVSQLMEDMLNHYNNLYKQVLKIYDIIDGYKKRYVNICEKAQINYTDFMMPHDASLYQFSEQSYSQNYQIFTTFYKQPEKLAVVYEKNGANFLKLQLNMLSSIFTTYDDLVFYLKTEISLLASNSQDCLFFLVSSLMEKVPPKFAQSVMKLLTDINNMLSDIDSNVKEETGIILDIDYNRVNFYFMMASNSSKLEYSAEPVDDHDNSNDNDSPADDEADSSKSNSENENSYNDYDEYVDFSGSLITICEYGGLEKDEIKNLKKLVDYYINMPDKDSREDDDRRFRKDIQISYYVLYEKVFLRFAKDNNPPKLIRLFLDYGFLDERLLTDEQLDTLVSLPHIEKTEPCDVYRMSDWLMAIYTGKKMPSKNEFDMDYVEHIRDRKRQEALTSAQEKALLDDMEGRVKFEIENVVKYNCRLLSGNLLSFVPMLNMDSFDNSIEQLTVTSLKINAAIMDVLAIDYSAFYREQLYSAPEKKIDRETIQLQVYPDIVLFPVFGTNSIMWQDLSGKRSNTKGRFFFPAFFRGDMTNSMISLIGRFRWELCKSILGASWNNVSVASLTSEYCDYVQFYRKNHDLNAEKKEALKNQITKCRNNIREVFLMDYIQWIKNEFNGSIRLNKVARQMLSTYCPFPAKERERLAKTPIYADGMKRFNIQLQKKLHEIDLRYKALERNGVTLPQELIDTREFYKH